MKRTDRQGPELRQRGGMWFWLRLFVTLGFAEIMALAPTAQAQTGVSFWNNFHTISIYWTRAKNAKPPRIQYRKIGTATWKKAQALWWDEKSSRVSQANFQNNQYRGSIVNLEQNTSYDIRYSLDGGSSWNNFTGNPIATRGDNYISGGTTSYSAIRTTKLTISNGGTATGCGPGGTKPCWKIHDGQGTAIIDPDHQDDCVLITASYVVLRNFLAIRDCKEDEIKITSADVVVEQNTIEDWGLQEILYGNTRSSSGLYKGKLMREVPEDPCPNYDRNDFGRYGDAGIEVEGAKRGIVIQRNILKNPRYRSTRWEECAIWDTHALGPHAIKIFGAETASARGNVIRYNNIFATNTTESGGGVTLSQPANRFYDVINVNYNQDLDIYGNIIRNGTDDAIEADNYAVNVRIWGNYIDYNPKNISFQRMEAGPAYVFRNIFDRGDDSDFDSSPGTPGTYHMTLPGSGRDSRKVLMLESDNGDKALAVANGPVNYYHNTSLRTGPDGFWNTAYIGVTTKALLPLYNLTLKNNIWMTNQHYIYDDQPANYVQYVFDGEMYNKPSFSKDNHITYNVTNALGPVAASWKSDHGPAAIWTAPETPSGKYMATNAGTGVVIANFNDSGSRGRGAHQYSATADNLMAFGVGASWTYLPAE